MARLRLNYTLDKDMKINQSFPDYRGKMQYLCQDCGASFPGEELYYTCPQCGGVFLLQDDNFNELLKIPGHNWREIFDLRACSKDPCLKGIFRYYELMAPILEPEDIVSIGEGHTPIVPASPHLTAKVGQTFSFKNDGQNPSASFKDRGMACAFSFLKSLIRQHGWEEMLTICASTGDTSASAAMYGAYVGPPLTCMVLLPQGKVTPQQLAQPLGSGAMVLEIPGVFDDCMKIVEYLAEHYRVALLNSKNSWRILGQESYAFETAQWYDWDMSEKAVFVPIGNAGNISAILAGFLKLRRLGIIETMPKVVGVQSSHADPVFRFYQQENGQRTFHPVKVSASVAQAAMIGNPVSFPRVKALAEQYQEKAGPGSFHVVQVQEQEIIEAMLLANSHGHIACTQGGECLAGLMRAREQGIVGDKDMAILDATAHTLKFQKFQEMYYSGSFPLEYEINPKSEYICRPVSVLSQEERENMEHTDFIRKAVDEIVNKLQISSKSYSS